jgi:hypothetical protein
MRRAVVMMVLACLIFAACDWIPPFGDFYGTGAPTNVPTDTVICLGPTPEPTPACPPADPYGSFPPVPSVSLGAAIGIGGSLTRLTCDGGAGDDSPWLVPASGVVIHEGAAQLTLTVAGGMTLFLAESAEYAAAAQGTAPAARRPLGIDDGFTAGTFRVDVPPVGDWSIAVDVGINDVAHGAVWHGPFYFRVKVVA